MPPSASLPAMKYGMHVHAETSLISQVDTMKTGTLSGYAAALLLSLISFANPSVSSAAPTSSDMKQSQDAATLRKTWEANENGTAYKIIKTDADHFLVVYGNKENISGYVVYDRRDGSTGTDHVPGASTTSDITIGIQETSSRSIGVMLSSNGDTTSFIAKPYRSKSKTRIGIHAGSWLTTIADTPVQLRIDKNLVDATIDIGQCRLNGTIKSDDSESEPRLTLSPATSACAGKFEREFEAALLFSEDLAVI